MSNSYFLRKKILNIFKKSVILLLNIIARIYRFFFAKRTIMFVSNRKIRTIRIGLFSQAIALVFVFFVCDIFVQSLKYDKIIDKKSKELSHLKSVNNYFEKEFNHVNEKLKKVNDYLILVTGDRYKNSPVTKKAETPKNIKRDDLSQSNQKTFDQIKEAAFALGALQGIARERISDIENTISDTGLILRRMPKNKFKAITNKDSETEISLNDTVDFAKGGPLLADDISYLEDSSISSDLKKHLEKVQFTSEFDRLFLLEKLVFSFPIARKPCSIIRGTE